MAQKFCTRCGVRLESDVRVCRACGAAVTQAAIPTTTAAPPSTDVLRPPAGVAPPAAPPPIPPSPPIAASPPPADPVPPAPAGPYPLMPAPVSEGRLVRVALVAAALVLGLAVCLAPAFSGDPKHLWTFSLLWLAYRYARGAAQVHGFPGTLWWPVVAAAAGLLAVVAALGAASARKTAMWRPAVACAAVSAGAAIGAAETGVDGFNLGMGIGTWGVVLGAAVLGVAAIGVRRSKAGGRAGQVPAGIAVAGVVALLIAAIPAMQSHHATPDLAASPDTTPSYTTTPAYSYDTTTTVAPSPADSLVDTYNFTETESGGYTFSGSISLGTPEPFQSGDIAEGSLTAGSACSINPGTDAVIPGTLTVQSTTSGFDAYAAAEVDWSSQAISGIEVGYSDGPQCEGSSDGDGSDDFNIESTDELSDGGSTEADLFIVVPDYYSPDDPKGNASLLAGVDLQLEEYDNSDQGVDVVPSGLTGPGASTDDGYHLPVDPSARPAASQAQTFQITDSGGTVYSSADLGSTEVGSLDAGQGVSVACVVEGPTVDDDDYWDRILDPAGYVPDADVNTQDAEGIPSC